MPALTPLYATREVCRLAKDGLVEFSRNATLDYQKLGFTEEQAIECISYLDPGEFDGCRTYQQKGQTVTFDVYLTTFYRKKLYIKLRLRVSSSGVYVTSFHTERPF